MNKLIVVLLLTFFSKETFCQDTTVYYTNSVNVEKLNRGFWLSDSSFFRIKSHYFDPTITYIISDSIKNQIVYKKYFANKSESWITEYYSNGHLVQRKQCRDSGEWCLNYLETAWYENGSVFYEIDWNVWHKKMPQKIYHYYPNGKVQREFWFAAMAHLGQDITYYENGMIKSIINYKEFKIVDNMEQSVREGVSLYFGVDGKLIRYERYEADLLIETRTF